MNRSDKSSHNLKMRAGTRREPRVEETVVYHWGRILGAVVSLLLIAFLVYWFFSASPGTSVGDSNDPVSPEAEDPGMGTSVSGTVQRSATEPAPEPKPRRRSRRESANLLNTHLPLRQTHPSCLIPRLLRAQTD